MEKGWISIHRKIRDCEIIWDDKPFSRGQAWIDLLLRANHEDKEILFNGTYRKIERGQMLTSLTKLSDQWGWSRKKTTKFLNELKKAQMLDFESDNKSTAITIVKYEVYQNTGTAKEPQKNRKRTAEEHQRNTNNNVINNDNKINNNPPYPLTGEPESTAYDFNNHSNLENVRYVLNKKTYEHWEYIKDNQDLWICIKDWMEYKDSRKPKSSNHYANEKSMITLLNKFVDNSKEYGISEVVNLVNQSIGNIYAGIIWENLSKRSSTIKKTDWSKIQ